MKIGKGLFSREENWQMYTAEVDGYIYAIHDERNFDPSRGYRIEKRDGGNEYVYILTKRRKGYTHIEGKRAHDIYDYIMTERRHSDLYKAIGHDTYTVKEKDSGDTKVYSFLLHETDDSARAKTRGTVYDKSKTLCVITYSAEYISGYFPTLQECLKFAENKLLPNCR